LGGSPAGLGKEAALVSVFQIKRIISPETLRSIRPSSLLALLRPHRRFLHEHGFELPAARDGASLDVAALSRLLQLPDLHPPVDLADALFYINEMSTPEGMDALSPALEGGDFALSMFRGDPADVAVRAWLADPQILLRKHAEIFASRPRQFKYFQGRVDPPPPLPKPTPEVLRPLESHLAGIFEAKGRGRGTQLSAYAGADDSLFMVRHGDARRREGALRGVEETSVLYRPLKFDVVGYESFSGTLRVYARSKWEVSLYRGAFGQYLFGAMDHFSGEGRYTLEPLRSGDRRCLACGDAAPIHYVTLTELHLLWGGLHGSLEVHRAADVFAALGQRKAAVPAGPRIVRASFDLILFGVKQARRVTIVPPNIARYSHEHESPLVDRWLRLRGFIGGDAEGEAGGTEETNQLLLVP
jgi:hypothetical protein